MKRFTGRQIVLIAGAIACGALLVVGIYGLVRGPAPRGPARSSTSRSISASGNSHPDQPSLPATALPSTSNPLVYARAVATTLFDWSTSSGDLPSDYSAPVLADADPSGEETPGLVTDVATYLPTTDQWLYLATMNVTQSLAITSAQVPADWSSIATHSNGQLRPGTVAVTITGTRHRTGTWEGQPQATSTPVSFTVFAACRPAFARCHVLRLSQVNNPLE